MSSVTYTQDISRLDTSDLQFCKKCDLQIFEGHAYELGDDRWHINCFKCSKCDLSLGCNSNFLVLGNGNLICSNCSYNCKQCNKKIDDLAILTGDQAYCSNCFKCRSCKQKIEDLRYARTSKGLFCMSCHEKLIAKKKKYDAKKRQLALLQQHKDESEREREAELSNTSSQRSTLSHNGMYNLGNNSSSSLSTRHKNLPTAPASKSLSQSLKDSPKVEKPPFESKESFQSSKSEAGGSLLNFPVAPESIKSSNKNVSNDDFSIEEVNDSDDELNKRNSQKIDRSENKKSLILSSYKTPQILETPTFDDNDNGSIFLGIINTPDSPESIKKSTVKINDNLKPSKALGASPADHKNIFILSPKQFQDTDFESNRGYIHDSPIDRRSISSQGTEKDSNNLYVAYDHRRAHSPMANVNRQARVMEVADYQLKDVNIESKPSSQTQLQPSEITTPKKNGNGGLGFSSPPPKMPLPSTPNRNELNNFPDTTPRGLGLEGIPTIDNSEHQNRIRKDETKASPLQLNTTPLVIGNATPAVTNLEEDIPEENSRNLSRKNTLIRTPKINIRHKRSISGGNGGMSNKFGFFRSNSTNKHETTNDSKGHSRHVSEGSIVNGNSAFVTPPLPKTSPSHYASVNKSAQYEKTHNRSFSDTPFLTSLELQEEQNKISPLRLEIKYLESHKSSLSEEIKKMIEQKEVLLSNLKEIQQEVASNKQNLRLVRDEVSELESTKRDLTEANNALLEENRNLTSSLNYQTPMEKTVSGGSRSILDVETSISNIARSSSPIISGPSLSSETIISEEPVAETQKATRLKFWRRPKNSNSNTPQLQQTANGSNKISHSYSSHALHLPQDSNISHNDGSEKKGISSFVTKSRSTNILDTFLNNTNINYDSIDEEGAPLFTSTLQKRANYEGCNVPLIVRKCIDEVEKRGLDMEGIYRISGGNSAISAIENAFANFPQDQSTDEKQILKLDSVIDGDINAVTSALKRYLRKLPDPIIPYHLYDLFIKICSTIPPNDEERRVSEMKNKIINALPPANKETLSVLCKHLDLISSYANVNRMGMKNLSVVFAPTLARDETGTREMLDMGHRNDVTEFLFNNYKKIF